MPRKYTLSDEQRAKKAKLGRILGISGTGKRKNLTEERMEKLRTEAKLRFTGSVNPNWKGNKVGYRSLHNWVQLRLGKPNKCEHCKNGSLKHRQYHWANKSGKYKRELSDWIRLCVKCHKLLDKNRNHAER